MYIPHCFNSFQGFSVEDIKEFRSELRMEIILKPNEDRNPICNICGHQLGAKHDAYWTTAQHLRAFGWKVSVSFPRGKYHCSNCNKVRSEWIDFLSPTSPHITLELAWWINSSLKSVLSYRYPSLNQLIKWLATK